MPSLLTETILQKLVLDSSQEITINNIYQIYQIVDHTNLYLKEEYHSPDCLRCGICCSGVFEVSPIEARVIEEALVSDFIPQELFPTIPQDIINQRLALARDQLETALQKNHYVCPFYNNQTGCLIYKVRPIICRTFEIAVPDFDFMHEIKKELYEGIDINSGILCPNLKKTNAYPRIFKVWDFEGLMTLLVKMYPAYDTYEARLLAFFKYKQNCLELTGQPVKFKLNNYLKIISEV